MKRVSSILFLFILGFAAIFVSCSKSDDDSSSDSSTVLGKIDADFSVKETEILTKENLVGNMICDAYKAYAVSKGQQVDLALSNGGALRCAAKRPDSLYKAGNFTENMLKELLAFDMTLKVVEMTGKELISTLERGVSELPKRAYWFVNVSKEVKVVVNINKPAQIVDNTNKTITSEGQRIVSLKINNVPVDSAKVYKVAIHNYIADGGDNFIAFLKIPATKKVDLGDYRESMRFYLKSAASIKPVIEQRITINN